MPDMIVRLYDLPSLEAAQTRAASQGIAIRRVLAPEIPRLLDWARTHFPSWVPEIEVTCQRLPITCWVAIASNQILGFAAYDAICQNFFGPTGVHPDHQGKGIGSLLLIATLHAQRAQGYAYAIIGGVGPAAYYTKVVGAQLIEHSAPGIYGGMLSSQPSTP